MGRPRSSDIDEAIIAAGRDLFVEGGATGTSIDAVARRAGVTRATVYRRYSSRDELLLACVESIRIEADPAALDWPTIEAMIADWATVLSRSVSRRLIRRLYASIDDQPELLNTYRSTTGELRTEATRRTLERARSRGRLPDTADPEIIERILAGAVLQHLGSCPDSVGAREVESYLRAVLTQVGYRPSESDTSTGDDR